MSESAARLPRFLRTGMTSSWHHLPRIIPYLKPQKRLAAASMALMGLGVAVSVALPWPMAVLVDTVLGNHPPARFIGHWFGTGRNTLLFVAVFGGFLLALVGNGINVVNEYVNTKLDHSLRLAFRADLFENSQRLSLTFHDENRAGMFAQNINTHTAALGRIVVEIPPLIESLLTLFFMFWICLRMDALLAVLALTVVPFIYYSTVYYGSQIEPRLLRTRNLEGQSLSIIHEAMQMLRVIIAFRREDYEHNKFVSQARDAVGERIAITVRQTLFSFAVNVITAAGTATVLGVGAKHVIDHRLTVGQLLVFMGYIAAVYLPLQTISSTIAAWQEQLVDMHLALELLDREPEVVERHDACTIAPVRGHVAFDRVGFSYPKRTDTLVDLTFDIAPGQVVAIVGPTGAGKTTLANLIPRFYDVASGAVLVDGIDVRDLTFDCLRKHISLVLQEPLLFQGTIEDNIRYGRLNATEAEIIAAAKAAGVHEFVSQLPLRYRTLLGERGSMLSGGERQRICIARAFLKNAPILILDEPTSSIDSRTENAILDALDRLMVGRTTFIIAHRLSTVRRADVVLVLQDGRLVQQGTHAELAALPGLYRQLWDAQVGSLQLASDMPTAPALPAVLALPAPEPAAPVPAIAASSFAAQPDAAPVVRVPAPAVRTRPKIVVLGMMTKMPVAGVVWQTAQYLVGLERMGYDAYYVEAHARTPSMLVDRADDDGSKRASAFIAGAMQRFGLADRWAYQALHSDGECYGLSSGELATLYRDAALIINLHGGTEPREEHAASGRLVYVETDPVQLQVELHDELPATVAFLEPHCAFFTFGENIGAPDCGVPVPERFAFAPTRQPVVLDFWRNHGIRAGERFTTIGNWRQAWRQVALDGETYGWSKHEQWEKLLELPRLVGERFELALSSITSDERVALQSRGWHVRDALEVSRSIDPYRGHIAASRGELTVAKDQNVRLRSGWFSDRSATYLAAGRPVVTEETGFSNVLPTGTGLFGFVDVDEAAAAIEAIEQDYPRHSRAASAIAAECFAHDVVLGDLLDHVGVELPRPVHPTTPAGRIPPIPDSLVLEPIARRPLRLAAETEAAARLRPIPGASGEQATPDATIVVATHDNLACLRLCIESVLSETGGLAVELIVVDNASTDGTAAYLAALDAVRGDVTVISNDVNAGFAASINQAIATASGEIVVILNDDTIVTPGWLSRLRDVLADVGVGAVGPATNRCGTDAEVPDEYTTYGELRAAAAARAEAHAGVVEDVEMLAMFCMALRLDVCLGIGPLDDGFGLGLFEDDDYAQRLRAVGLRLCIACDVLVHHFGEATIGRLVPTGEHAQLFEQNRRRYELRWGETWHRRARRRSLSESRALAALRATVASCVPPNASVLVVSGGDDEMLRLGAGRRAAHFPQGADGSYAGHHPGTSDDAIAELDRLHSAGAEYLVLPGAARWWLDHYDAFARHLESSYDIRADTPDVFVVALTPAPVRGERVDVSTSAS